MQIAFEDYFEEAIRQSSTFYLFWNNTKIELHGLAC